jgi:hypothetical protein
LTLRGLLKGSSRSKAIDRTLFVRMRTIETNGPPKLKPDLREKAPLAFAGGTAEELTAFIGRGKWG